MDAQVTGRNDAAGHKVCQSGNHSSGRGNFPWSRRWLLMGCAVVAGMVAGCSSNSGGSKTPEPAVTISVSPASITLGNSSTLTWSSTNATSCTASGAWTGTENTSGSESVTPSATGTDTYTLTCTGAGGNISNAAALTVRSPPAAFVYTLDGDGTIAGFAEAQGQLTVLPTSPFKLGVAGPVTILPDPALNIFFVASFNAQTGTSAITSFAIASSAVFSPGKPSVM